MALVALICDEQLAICGAVVEPVLVYDAVQVLVTVLVCVPVLLPEALEAPDVPEVEDVPLLRLALQVMVKVLDPVFNVLFSTLS